MRATTNAVVKNFDSPWWRGGWPFFHGQGCTGVAADAADPTVVFILWGGLLR
jgi:hypothetical protein